MIIIIIVIASSSRKLLFSNTHYVPAVLLYDFHTSTPSTQQPSKEGTVISPILQMRKLRHRTAR